MKYFIDGKRVSRKEAKEFITNKYGKKRFKNLREQAKEVFEEECSYYTWFDGFTIKE